MVDDEGQVIPLYLETDYNDVNIAIGFDSGIL